MYGTMPFSIMQCIISLYSATAFSLTFPVPSGMMRAQLREKRYAFTPSSRIIAMSSLYL
jgi:hypothetical protein